MAEPVVIKNCVVYNNENVCLDIDNLTINPGRITFIIEKSGLGKSSLLKEIGKNEKAFEIIPPTESEYATAKEFMVAAAARHERWDSALAKEAMAELGISDETFADSSSVLLFSAVEALACREDYVLLSEPNIGLTDRSRKMFYMLMRDFCRGETAFVATVSEIGDAEMIIDDVIFLKDGKLLIAEDKRSLLSRAVFVGGNCCAVELDTKGVETYGLSNNGKIMKAVCLLGKDEHIAETCDVSVLNIGLQTLYDYMCMGKAQS